MLLLLACTSPTIEVSPCRSGFGRAADGNCYALDDSGGSSDSGGVDSGDSGGDLDSDTGPVDLDGDGHLEDDCDDGNAEVNPSAEEVCDGIDNDCDGLADNLDAVSAWVDADGDGYAPDDGDGKVVVSPCAIPDGFSADVGDCDDADPSRNPGVADIEWNDTDEDCDGEDLHTWISVTAIGNTTCGVDAFGDVHCWGFGAELADEVTSGHYVDAESDGTMLCAIDIAGAVTCWGDTPEHHINGPIVQLDLTGYGFACFLDGTGTPSCLVQNEWVEAPMPPEGLTFERIAFAYGYGCGLSEGQLVCWGENPYGSTPPEGAFGALVAGPNNTCVLDDAGEVTCWGFEDADHSVNDPPDGPFSEITLGAGHACAATPDGVMTCWGYNLDGQTDVPTDASALFDVTAGSFHTCALDDDLRAWCWGLNTYGQIDVP